MRLAIKLMGRDYQPLPQGKVQARNPGAYDFIGEVTCAGVTGPTPWIVYVPGTESGF